MATSKKILLAYSGGLDSTVLMYSLQSQGYRVECVYFAYGSKHSEKEYAAAKSLTAARNIPLQVISLPFVKELFQSSLLGNQGKANPSIVVPGRNSIFASILMGYADSIEADGIALAIHADDHAIFPDTRPEWVAALRLFSYHGTMRRVSILTPFYELTRRDICRLGQSLQVPFEQTWSCYEGGEIPCGVCLACKGRNEALAALC